MKFDTGALHEKEKSREPDFRENRPSSDSEVLSDVLNDLPLSLFVFLDRSGSNSLRVFSMQLLS